MNEQMEFPETFEEFAKEYGFKDDKEIYTNGSDLIPIFRVKQWLEHTQKPTTKNDLALIHTEGLDEEIRCTMCTNSMKSDRGCDGGCVVNNAMYKKVMDAIERRIHPTTKNNLYVIPQEPCEMTAEEYRQRMIQAFHNADTDELIAVCVLPTEKEFEHLEWLLKNHYKKEPCEDAIRREDALMALCRAVHKNDDTIPCPNQRVSCLWSKTKVQDYAREIYNLSPVIPKSTKPKTAHWVYKIYGGFHEQGDWYCSHCDYQYNYGKGHAKFCPECGYEMSEPSEEISEYDKRRDQPY